MFLRLFCKVCFTMKCDMQFNLLWRYFEVFEIIPKFDNGPCVCVGEVISVLYVEVILRIFSCRRRHQHPPEQISHFITLPSTSSLDCQISFSNHFGHKCPGQRLRTAFFKNCIQPNFHCNNVHVPGSYHVFRDTPKCRY